MSLTARQSEGERSVDYSMAQKFYILQTLYSIRCFKFCDEIEMNSEMCFFFRSLCKKNVKRRFPGKHTE